MRSNRELMLEIKKLYKHFVLSRTGQRGMRPIAENREVIRAVDGVSFTIDQGESFGLVGESGCGKTTLARCVLRLLEPTAGQIFFMGKDFLALSGVQLRRQRKRIQAVFQDPYGSLNPRMSIGKIVEEPLAIHHLGTHRERKEQVGELLQMVGLDDKQLNRYPEELSGGQRQRVALARALVTHPDLLVADEPVSSLDISIQAQIVNLLQTLKREFQLTLLFISHGLPIVRHLCDRVAVMCQGRIVELTKTREIFENPLHPYTRELLEGVPEPDPRIQRPESGQRKQRPPRAGSQSLGELEEVVKDHWVAGG